CCLVRKNYWHFLNNYCVELLFQIPGPQHSIAGINQSYHQEYFLKNQHQHSQVNIVCRSERTYTSSYEPHRLSIRHQDTSKLPHYRNCLRRQQIFYFLEHCSIVRPMHEGGVHLLRDQIAREKAFLRIVHTHVLCSSPHYFLRYCLYLLFGNVARLWCFPSRKLKLPGCCFRDFCPFLLKHSKPDCR